jgi:iron complex outermembrane receptor protein
MPISKKVRRHCLYSTAVLVLAGHATTGLHAQALEEITVIAQKREQSLQDVSISVSAFSGDQIRKYGMTSLSELGAITPGLVVWEFGNSPTVSVFTIRGVSQNDFADHNEVPNAVYSDGVYMSFIGAIGSQMYDVERVEVLRGPQGTLFGRNATGGLVQVINRKPTEDFEGYAELTLAEHNQVKFEGAVSGPLAPTLLGRLSVSTNRYDGFVKNRIGPNAAEDEQYNGRLQLLWQPGDSVSALLSLRASRVDNINVAGYDIRPAARDPGNDNLIDFVPNNIPNPTCPMLYGINAPAGQTDCFGYTEADDDPYTASFSEGNLARSFYGASLTVDWSAGAADITWITDAQWIDKAMTDDTDGTPLPVLHVVTDQDAVQFSSELRASGQAGALRWTAGAYFLLIDGDYITGFDSGLFGAAVRNAYELETMSEALFAQLEYQVADNWTLIGGFRYTWDQKDFAFRPNCSGPGCIFFEAPGSAQVLGLVAEQNTSDYSGKLGIDWQPMDALLIYTSVTRGTKAGGFAGPVLAAQAPGALAYGSEVLWNYETGFKWTLPGGHTRLNASLFYYDYNGYQDFDLVGLTQTITNKNAEVFGGEVELASSPAKGLNMSLGVSVLDATVKDVTLPSGRIADRNMALAPSLSVTGLVRQEWAVSFGYISLQGDMKYTSARHFRSLNHPALREGGYAVVNARFGFESQDQHWGIAAFVKNLTDKKYRAYAFEDLSVNGVVNANYGAPRWFGITATVNW